MKEREQKTAAQTADCLQGDKQEAEELAGVQIDEKHLMELIVSPYNMNRAYRKVISNGTYGGVRDRKTKVGGNYFFSLLLD